MTIADNIRKIKVQNVILVAATKKRHVDEIKEAIKAGITVIGENYVQEAEPKYEKMKGMVKFHLIGHLQTNKVKKAVEIFDMIETVDSVKLAKEIDKCARDVNKVMPVLIEVNIAKEKNKTGCYPEKAEELAKKIVKLKNLELKGLMTMAQYSENPEETRQYFRKMKLIFDEMKEKGFKMEFLSMGMSDSYKTAIEEGSNMIRVGTAIFGQRQN